jgi:hypothetical protein
MRTNRREGDEYETLAVLVLIAVPRAQVGSTSINGAETADANGNVGLIPKNGFLFEPEVSLASLKTLPIWSVQADG